MLGRGLRSRKRGNRNYGFLCFMGFVYPCYPIIQASQALYESKNLLILPLSKEWSDSKEIEKLNRIYWFFLFLKNGLTVKK